VGQVASAVTAVSRLCPTPPFRFGLSFSLPQQIGPLAGSVLFRLPAEESAAEFANLRLCLSQFLLKQFIWV